MTGSTATTQTYEIGYTIDTSGFIGPNTGINYFISSLALQVTSQLISASLVSAPTNTGTWTLSSGGLNNSGCDGSGNGWLCLEGGQAKAPNSSPYTWDFSITVPTGSLLSVGTVKANYGPSNGVITSEQVALPEGLVAELPLFITGLVLWLWWCKRREPSSSRTET
jgi:hypothetical protein